MAEKIKGITVTIGGDTTGLNAALRKTDATLKSTQNELKTVNRLLKADPKNTELLAQKQKLLNTQITDTKTELQSLENAKKTADNQMASGTEVNQNEYRKLVREIESAKIGINNLEKESKETDNALAQVSKNESGIGKIKNAFLNAGESAKTAANGGFTVFKGALSNLISNGISKAVSGLKSLGSKFLSLGEKADDLNTTSAQTGISTDDLQKMEYAADRIDVSVDDITGAMKKMKKNMASTSAETKKAWETLGVSMTDSAGHTKGAKKMFDETVLALSKVKNETERDQLAMQLFGKSADSLAGVIDDGGAALKAMGDEAAAAGVIMSKDTLKAANDFNDSMDTLKATGKGAMYQIGAAVAGELQPKLQEMTKELQAWLKSEDGKKFIKDLSEGIKNLVEGFVAISTWIVNNQPLVLNILAAVTAAIVVYTAVQWAAAVATMAVNWPILLVVAGIAAIIAVIIVCIKYWDGIKAVAIGCWNAICSAFSAAGKWFMDYVVNPVKNAFSTVFNWIKNALKAVANFYISIGNGIIGGTEFIINGILNAVNLGIAGINKMLSGITSVLSYVGINVDWQIPSFQNISLPRIPMLANGGTVLNGSAIVGEAGPELLTMQNGRTTVQPLTNGEKAQAAGSSVSVTFGTFNNFDTSASANQIADIVGERLKFAARRGLT